MSLSMFEHQHPEFVETLDEGHTRRRQERRKPAKLPDTPDPQTETVAEFMDRVVDTNGTNSRRADIEAEQVSEEAWNKFGIASEDAGKLAMRKVDIKVPHASDLVEHSPHLPPGHPGHSAAA